MIEGVIFDLDGIVIDSEPLWKIAEKRVFRTVGIELSTDMCNQTTGLDNLSTVLHWYAYKPWNKKSCEYVASEILEEVERLIRLHGTVRPGLLQILDLFDNLKLPVAIASSSEMRIINTVLEKLKLKDKFAAVHSSEFEEFGKPHPAVYLSAAGMLGKNPGNCLVFEDSFYGALAAKAARMKVVAVLEKKDYAGSVFDFADLKVRSLESFGIKEFDLLNKR